MPDDETLLALKTIYLAFRGSIHAARGLVLLAPECELPEQAALQAAGCRIAGHAVLLVLSGTSAARQAVRAGWCDFMVTTLDEALRVLKLAVRRGAPTGVVLCARTSAVLDECVERGVQPQLLGAAVPELERRGAARIEWPLELDKGEAWVHWHGRAREAAALDRVDAAALAAVQIRHEEKQRWLSRAARGLGRTGAWSRVLPMTAAERTAFHAACAALELAGTVTMDWPPGLLRRRRP